MIDQEIENIVQSDKHVQLKVIELHSLGKKICAGFNNEALQAHFSGLLPNLQSEINEYRTRISEMENAIEKNEVLISERQAIESDFDLLNVRARQLEELRAKREACKKLSEVEEEVARLESLCEVDIDRHIELIKSVNGALSIAATNKEKQLSGLIKEAEGNLIAISQNMTEAVSKLSVLPFQEKADQYAIRVDEMIVDYNLHVEKIITIKADLEEISREHESVIEKFKMHRLENEEIYGVLKNREGVLHYVEKLNREMIEKLERFDSEIREMIEHRDKLPVCELKEVKRYL